MSDIFDLMRMASEMCFFPVLVVETKKSVFLLCRTDFVICLSSIVMRSKHLAAVCKTQLCMENKHGNNWCRILCDGIIAINIFSCICNDLMANYPLYNSN